MMFDDAPLDARIGIALRRNAAERTRRSARADDEMPPLEPGYMDAMARDAPAEWPPTEEPPRMTPEAAPRAAPDPMAETSPDAGWPEPVRFDGGPLPNVDPAWLPGWAGEFAAALAAATETPAELAVSMVIATASCAVAGLAEVEPQPGHREPLNLWLATALPPGNRKSAVVAAATLPLTQWERDARDRLKPEIDRLASERLTAEARIKRKRAEAAGADAATCRDLAEEVADLEANLPGVPAYPRLWTSDCTPERLGALLAEQGERMAWLSAEGGVFELVAGRYAGGVPNLDLILKAHAGDAERVDRGGRPPVHLERPLLTMGLAIQPDVLRGLAAKPGFRGRGLLGRFLYLLPPSPIGYRSLEPKPIPEAVAHAYAAGIAALLDLPRSSEGPHTIRLSSEARSVWRAYAEGIEHAMRPGGSLEHAADWGGKAPGAAARLAGVLHCIEHAHGEPWAHAVTAGTMAAALELMEAIQAHTLAALGMMGADPAVTAAQDVLTWIVRGRRERFTVRDAHQALKGTFPRAGDLRGALDVLAERDFLRIIEAERAGPGRPPSPVVEINPRFVEGWR